MKHPLKYILANSVEGGSSEDEVILFARLQFLEATPSDKERAIDFLG